MEPIRPAFGAPSYLRRSFTPNSMIKAASPHPHSFREDRPEIKNRIALKKEETESYHNSIRYKQRPGEVSEALRTSLGMQRLMQPDIALSLTERAYPPRHPRVSRNISRESSWSKAD